jgi:hypothetical protein
MIDPSRFAEDMSTISTSSTQLQQNPSSRNTEALETWLIDLTGNIAATDGGLAVLRRIANLDVPLFVSSEEAMEWGSRLNAAQHATLVDIQRTCSNAARENGDLQRMVHLATRSQLMREAAEAFTPGLAGASAKRSWEF